MHLHAVGARQHLCRRRRIPSEARRHTADSRGRKARHAKYGKRAAGVAVLLSRCGYHRGDRRARRDSRDSQTIMSLDVLCLRPEADFQRVGAVPAASLKVDYRAANDLDIPQLMKQARALVIPAVGPKLPTELFAGTSIQFIQVTGAGLDRLDLPFLRQRGIVAANVSGGSNDAVAEYAVTAASVLLRRFFRADTEIRHGNYRNFRARMIADSLLGLDGLTVGMVGFGIIGVAVATAFHRRGCAMLYYDPAPRDPRAGDALGAKATSLQELLRAADVVSLHVPLLPQTTGLIGARELAMMKTGAVLIQATRGSVVDES